MAADDRLGLHQLTLTTIAANETLPAEQPASVAGEDTRSISDTSHPADVRAVDTITLVLVGDTGLNGSMQPVRADAALRHGKPIPWAETTRGIKAEINGDLNFANLETVVSERNSLKVLAKAFNFRSHPEGVRHLVKTGFNLFSAANNHAFDFGPEGARDTLVHLSKLHAEGLFAHAGIGVGRDSALQPQAVDIKGTRILLSAVGIGPGSFGRRGARADTIGQMGFSSAVDFADTVAKLGEERADYRILSVHYGTELSVVPAASDVRKLRETVSGSADVDLVVGHHAHVAAGVESVGGKLIFYGLGNFLHQGMQDMAKFGQCRDYGLLARVHLAKAPGARLEAKAIEVVPLKDMHEAPRRWGEKEAGERVRVLNYLARQLDDVKSGARGIRFSLQPGGTGLYCAPGAAEVPGEIGLLCKGWTEGDAAPTELERRIANSCGRTLVASRRGRGAKDGVAAGRPSRPNARVADSVRQRTTRLPGRSLFGF